MQLSSNSRLQQRARARSDYRLRARTRSTSLRSFRSPAFSLQSCAGGGAGGGGRGAGVETSERKYREGIADVRKVWPRPAEAAEAEEEPEQDGKGGGEDGEARARRMRKWRSVPRDTRRDCFGRAPISTALWAPGGICGVPYIAGRALLLRGSRQRRH